MGDFTMPSLGADMESGKVTRWLVKPGDEVHRGDIVAEVETEKSNIEVEIFENGRIDELVVPEGERVPVGAVLARISSQGTAAPPSEPTASSPPAPRPREVGLHEGPSRPVKVSPEAKATVPASAAHPAPVESPLVRRLAERLGVDLASLPGSGHGGAMTRADVERAALASAKEVAHRGPGERRPSSSPFARRLAERLGVDLAAVSGSGPGGSVIERDVRQAALAARHEEVTPAPTTTEDRQRAMQRAIGALMARSKREIPHYYLSATIDLTAAAAWLEQANLERPVADRLVMATLLFSATARAVARVPVMNGFYIDGAFTPSEAVHLGIAISQRSGGLIAPAIHDAQQLTLDELMTRVRDLVRRARAGVLRSSEMSSPTLTVTNLGDLGVDSVFGVIYPPQVALVGFGRVREHAWAEGGVLGVRPCIVATLSGDHRVSDGMRGAHFLTEIDRLLQEPGKL
jgi:pyruvate dehydrogenase E2 component (dihydrolipoamide acetyltransferase)